MNYLYKVQFREYLQNDDTDFNGLLSKIFDEIYFLFVVERQIFENYFEKK
jgi:hypothetical protein